MSVATDVKQVILTPEATVRSAVTSLARKHFVCVSAASSHVRDFEASMEDLQDELEAKLEAEARRVAQDGDDIIAVTNIRFEFRADTSARSLSNPEAAGVLLGWANGSIVVLLY